MPTLTSQQQQDLKIYKKTGELGTLKNQLLGDTGSLNYILIEHCLEWLNHSDHARDRFYSVLRLEIPKNINEFLKSNKDYQVIIIQVMLSKCVIPFLSDVSKQYIEESQKVLCLPISLQGRLLRVFTETFFGQAEGLDKASKTINKIYLDNLI